MAGNNRTVDRIQAVWNLLGGEDGVERFIQGDQVVTTRGNVILLGSLRLVGEPIVLPPLGGIFCGHHYFAEGTHRNGVLVRQIDDAFKECFFDVQEVSRNPATVTVREIEEPMRSMQILSALGDKNVGSVLKSQITLANLHVFLRTADKGRTYICYIPDKGGVAREVRAVGVRGGWGFTSPVIEYPEPKGAPGHRVVSAA